MRKLVFEIAIDFLSQGGKLGSLKMAVAVLSLPNMIFGVCGMQGGMPGLFVVKNASSPCALCMGSSESTVPPTVGVPP